MPSLSTRAAKREAKIQQQAAILLIQVKKQRTEELYKQLATELHNDLNKKGLYYKNEPASFSDVIQEIAYYKNLALNERLKEKKLFQFKKDIKKENSQRFRGIQNKYLVQEGDSDEFKEAKKSLKNEHQDFFSLIENRLVDFDEPTDLHLVKAGEKSETRRVKTRFEERHDTAKEIKTQGYVKRDPDRPSIRKELEKEGLSGLNLTKQVTFKKLSGQKEVDYNQLVDAFVNGLMEILSGFSGELHVFGGYHRPGSEFIAAEFNQLLQSEGAKHLSLDQMKEKLITRVTNNNTKTEEIDLKTFQDLTKKGLSNTVSLDVMTAPEFETLKEAELAGGWEGEKTITLTTIKELESFLKTIKLLFEDDDFQAVLKAFLEEL